MKEVDGRPQLVVEAGVVECSDQGVEDTGDGAGDMVALRERSRIGFVLEGAVCAGRALTLINAVSKKPGYAIISNIIDSKNYHGFIFGRALISLK
jgi:hypothetical protein